MTITRLYKTVKRAIFKQLFTKKISPADMDQGNLGDCYFVSSLAAVAAYEPSILEKIIKEASPGNYEVYFYDVANVTDQGYTFKGCPWKKITIKEDGTLELQDGRPKYSITEEDPDELWFPLVEKAYAKWKGGYDQIGNGGYPQVALSEITGRKSFLVSTDTRIFSSDNVRKNAILGVFESADRNNWKVVCATKGQGEIQDGECPDVYSGHAYSYHGYNHETHMVKLRNPWGQGTNPEGYFELTMDQFLKYYDSIAYVK